MYFVLGADGKEYGPASMANLRSWIAEGRVNAETKVRKADASEWVPVGLHPDFEPGKSSVKVPAGALLEDHGEFSILGCFEKSWELFTQNVGILMGACTMLALMQVLFSLNPIFGYVFSFGFSGIFYGGLALLFLKRIRGEPAEFSDLFSGFKEHTKQLVFASIFRSAIEVLVMLPLVLRLSGHREVPLWLCVASLVLSIGISACFAFVFPLIVDRGYAAGEAFNVSIKLGLANFWRILGLMLLGMIVVLLGFICFIVGVFVALPVFFGALVFAYLQVSRVLDHKD